MTDNALVAFECFHTIEHCKKQQDSFCAYKLDLAKAYDRVDWDFLEASRSKLGFGKQWIGWEMSCVKSVRYSV